MRHTLCAGFLLPALLTAALPLQAAASGAGADVFVLARAAERRNKETEE